MSHAARCRAVREFSLERAGARLCGIYRNGLNRGVPMVRILLGNRHNLFDLAATLLEPEIAAATPANRPIHVVVKPNWFSTAPNRATPGRR